MALSIADFDHFLPKVASVFASQDGMRAAPFTIHPEGLNSMGTVTAIFFPWRMTFRRFDLQRHWWHRLAVVLFVIALVLFLPVAWVYTFAAMEPYPVVMPDIRFWTVDSNGSQNDLTNPPPAATQIVPESQQQDANVSASQQKPVLDFSKAIPIHASVKMPNGEYMEFVGKSQNNISTEWDKAMHKAEVKQWVLSIVISLATLLFVSYLLQTLYRALIFVVCGPAQKETPAGGSMT